MCDQDHSEKDKEDFEAKGWVTRRQFGALLGAGVAMALPRVVNAVTVTDGDVTIKTPDGTCDAYFVKPATGTGAGVLIWPDIFGLRPAFRTMGKRLAENGYAVLVVNPFYRVQNRRPPPKRVPRRRSRRSSRWRRRSTPRRTRPTPRRSSPGSISSRRWRRTARSARRATAWAARWRSGRRPMCRTASARWRRSTAAASSPRTRQPARDGVEDQGVVPRGDRRQRRLSARRWRRTS